MKCLRMWNMKELGFALCCVRIEASREMFFSTQTIFQLLYFAALSQVAASE